MQIHELTKRRKTNEGLLDNIKDAVSAAKTGYAAGKAGTGSTLGAAGTALGTFGKAITSPGFAAQSTADASAKSAMAKYDALKKKYGWADADDQPAAGATTAGQPAAAPNPQEQQQQVQAMVQQFTQEPEFVDLTAVLPDQGKVLKVEIPSKGGTPAEYFKDESGVWKNASGQPVKQSRQLEAMIDADQYSQVSPPAWGQPQTQQQGKTASKGVAKQAATPAAAPVQPAAGTPQTESIAEAVGNSKVQSIVANIIKKNRTAAAAAEKATANPKAAPKIEKAKQQVLAAASAPASKAPNRRAKSNMVKQAFTNYATQLVQAGGAAPEGDQAQTQPGQAQQTSAQSAKVNPVIQQKGLQGLKAAGASDATIADLTKISKTANGATLLKNVAGVAESRKPLTKRLEEALQLLKEEQVYITKDIRIRTAKGDYVKRVSDQTWYDPNGVPIDPVKYADYVAKLDKTPQAQTQYQADALKADKGRGPGGTDTGAQQSAAAAAAAPPPPPPPPPQAPAAAAAPQPDPMDQALQRQKMQQWLRGQNVDSLNAQIKDTTNQLRNAQIFGTGQADYLQQQLAQLIAMKV
jgi:hypothetical protein